MVYHLQDLLGKRLRRAAVFLAALAASISASHHCKPPPQLLCKQLWPPRQNVCRSAVYEVDLGQ